MEALVWLLIGLALGTTAVSVYRHRQRTNFNHISRKERRKEMILDTLVKLGKITNDEVEELFSVSNTTAYNYLEELEKEEKIKQIGERGRGVHYKLYQ